MTMSDAAQLSEPPNNWEMFRKWVQFCQDVSTNSGARYLGYQLRLSYDIKEWRLHLETIKPGTNWLKNFPRRGSGTTYTALEHSYI